MDRKCNAVVDSGAQVTVINKDCFKECKRGKQSIPARLKGVVEDNSLMAEVVDDVEIEMGGISKNNQVFVANISDECIIGLDTMKMFKIVLGVGKGMVGVNGKVMLVCLNMWEGRKYRFTLWKQSVEWSWGRRQSQKFQSQGIQKGYCWILEPGFPDCRFSCQVL